MIIGLTYDLRQDYLDLGYGDEETAEFDRPDTIDAIENTLKLMGHETVRIGNIRRLVSRLDAGERWDLVFNIAEGLHGIGREAQVPAILDAFEIPYVFSDPLVLALTLHKSMTKRVIRDLGIPTPDFVEIHNLSEIGRVSLDYPMFAKPLAEGTGKGIDASSVIKTEAQLLSVCKRLLRTFRQPVLLESFLPGREFTVGIIGTGEKSKSVGIIEIIFKESAEKEVYSYLNKERCEELIEYKKVNDSQAREAIKTALAAWRGLGCRDAGRVDLRCDKNGIPNIIELNPLAGIHPVHSDLPIICTLHGIEYIELLRLIIESATERLVQKRIGEVMTYESRDIIQRRGFVFHRRRSGCSGAKSAGQQSAPAARS